MKNLVLFIGMAGCFHLADCVNAHGAQPTLAERVRRIEWGRFSGKDTPSEESRLSAQILANSTRWGYNWLASTYKNSATGDRFLIPNENQEHTIRPATSVAVGLAVAIRTGVSDGMTDVSRDELIRRTTKLIKGVAVVHKANGGNWGDHWQSSVWAAQLCRAGWMMWDDLDDQTKEMICLVLVHEADRHIQPDYSVPYWNGKGGDSKAEENSWEATVLQQAIAMLPDHANVIRWKQVCSELQISAFARKSDMDRNSPVLDGKSPKQWLGGYNLREDGIVINHGLIHNDYMSSIAHLQMQSRHADGRMYANGEFKTYPGREQMVLWMISDAHLLQWLADHNALVKKKNWLADSTAQ